MSDYKVSQICYLENYPECDKLGTALLFSASGATYLVLMLLQISGDVEYNPGPGR